MIASTHQLVQHSDSLHSVYTESGDHPEVHGCANESWGK